MSHPCTIDVTPSSFRNGAHAASKRHRSFKMALSSVLGELEKNAYSQGDQIPGCETGIHIRKIRIGAPGDNVKPREGYRLIVQVLEANGKLIARCLDLYYKKDKSTISTKEATKLVTEANVQQAQREAAMDDLDPVDSN